MDRLIVSYSHMVLPAGTEFKAVIRRMASCSLSVPLYPCKSVRLNLTNCVHRASAPLEPLAAYADGSALKLYSLDVGLLGALSGLKVKKFGILAGPFGLSRGHGVDCHAVGEILAERCMPAHGNG